MKRKVAFLSFLVLLVIGFANEPTAQIKRGKKKYSPVPFYTILEAWKADCISRRLGILYAEPKKITESGNTAERKNSNFCLLEDNFIIEDL